MDLLVDNGTVITVDAERRIIENGAVAIIGEAGLGCQLNFSQIQFSIVSKVSLVSPMWPVS